jgi:hypothetical protein
MDTQGYWNERAGGMSRPGARWPRWDHFARCSRSTCGNSEISELWWAIGGMFWWLGCLTTLRTQWHSQFIGSRGGGTWIGVGAVAAKEKEMYCRESLVAFIVADSLATSQWYRAAYGDSLRRGKALRHIAGLDNDELRWCQRDQPRWDMTSGENSGRRLSTAWYFLPLLHYPPASDTNHRGGKNPSARLVDGEGIWTQDLWRNCPNYSNISAWALPWRLDHT